MGFNITLKTYIIDYLDPVDGGIPINIGLDLEGVIFSAIYWVHESAPSIFEVDDKFLKVFGVQETKELPFLDMVVKDIETQINRTKIYDSARDNY